MNRSALSSLICIATLSAFVFSAGCRKSVKTPPVSKIAWLTDLKTAQVSAKTSGKPVLVEFTAKWCPWCKRMEDSTFSDPAVARKMEAFVPVQIDVDSQKTVADRFGANARKNGGMGIPNILFLSSSGEKIKHDAGYRNAKSFMATLDTVLTPAGKGNR